MCRRIGPRRSGLAGASYLQVQRRHQRDVLKCAECLKIYPIVMRDPLIDLVRMDDASPPPVAGVDGL